MQKSILCILEEAVIYWAIIIENEFIYKFSNVLRIWFKILSRFKFDFHIVIVPIGGFKIFHFQF